jgi:Ca2+-binding RTX toxin-like protein
VTEVPASLIVEQSFARNLRNEEDGIEFYTDHVSGVARFVAIGNRVSLNGNPKGSSGIEVTMNNAGTTRADIFNNSVWDVARAKSGGASGIFVYPSDTVRADVNIVGNTVDRSATSGLVVRNAVRASGHLRLNLFDNIFSHAADGSGVVLGSEHKSTFTFRAGYNDYFANKYRNYLDGSPAGQGNHKQDPHFVRRSSGDLRLTASSPLIDRGQVCSPGGVAIVDASGHGRLSGSSVEIGAFERGSAAPSGVALLGGGGPDRLSGTKGDDILCGYGGADRLLGGGGADYLFGGPGADRIAGGPGDDTICASDRVRGNDRLDGGPGRDHYRADLGDARSSMEGLAACAP